MLSFDSGLTRETSLICTWAFSIVTEHRHTHFESSLLSFSGVCLCSVTMEKPRYIPISDIARVLTALTSKTTGWITLNNYTVFRQSHWSRRLRPESAAVHLLGLWGRIPPGTWMFISCECCVLSGRGFCVGPITHPEESYWVWCAWVW
jgi:hypothetical protein